MSEAEINLPDGTVTVARLMTMDGADISLPDIDRSTLTQLTDNQLVTLLVKIYTSRDPQYMNQHISKIAWRINQLPSDKVSAYIFQIMQHYRLSIEEMARSVSRTPVYKLCSDRGVVPSLALFIGLGHNGSNERIVETVNNALSSPQIMNYKQSTNMNGRVPATRKLFVGGLPNEVTDLSFLQYFQQYGEVIDSEVLGRFGFVTFADPTVAASLLKIIPGRTGVVNILGKNCGLEAYNRERRSNYDKPSYNTSRPNERINPTTYESSRSRGGRVGEPPRSRSENENREDRPNSPDQQQQAPSQSMSIKKKEVSSDPTKYSKPLPPQLQERISYILLNTYKEWGADRMNKEIQRQWSRSTHPLRTTFSSSTYTNIGREILQLRRRYVVQYVLGVLDYLGQNILAVHASIKKENDSIHYSTFFGLGDESTNPGIEEKVNMVIQGKAIKAFVYTDPEINFGFEALASSARHPPPVEIKKKKKKKAQTKESNSHQTNMLLNTYKKWGPCEMNRKITPEIAAMILQLTNEDVGKYIIGVLDHLGKDINAVNTSSYSTFFGLGDESTNPGISDKINTAVNLEDVQRFVYIAPETTFGFEAIVTLATSARQAVAEERRKKKEVQTKTSKTPSSALPPSVMPSRKRMRSDTNNVALHHSLGDKRLLSNFHAINPLQMDKNSNPASDSSTENVNTANGGDSARKPLIYSKQMLLSLRDEDFCVCRPDDLIDMTVKVAGGGGGGMMGRRQSSGRGNYGGQGNYNRGQDSRGGGEQRNNDNDPNWSRGKAVPRDLLEPGDGETDAEKAVSRINVETLLDMRLSNLNPPSSWEEEDCETKPSQQCLWDTPTREDDIKALAAADRIGGDVTRMEKKKKKPNPHDTAPALEDCKPLEVNPLKMDKKLNSTEQIDYKHLLTKFYQQHDDSKVSDVEETLQKLLGREAILFAMLASKYTTANALNSVFEERVKNVQITDHLSLLKIYLSVFHPSYLPNSESLLLKYNGGEDKLFAELANKFSAVNALDVCDNSNGKGGLDIINESSEEKENSSGDIPAVGSEIGNERLPQQDDSQVMHSSGGDEASAQAKPNNDLLEGSPQSKNVLHENRRNIADDNEINLDSDDEDDNEIDNTVDIEAAPNQSMMPWPMMMMNPQISRQPLQLDNNEHHVLNPSQASSMQMLAGMPQNNMNLIQMFGQYMVNNPEKMMQIMEQMSMGGMNDTTNQSSGDMEGAVGSEMGNQKMPHRPPQQADTQVMHGSGRDGSDSAQGSATPASKPSNESTTREEAEDGESPELKDALEAEKTAAQEYGHGDDDLDYAITTLACTDSGSLPSIWLETKSLEMAIKNETFIDLPNEMKVRVLKFVGAGCYGSVWHVHLYIGSSSKPIECVVKVQYPSKSLNKEYTIHLKLAHRVGQSHSGQEYPFPISHQLITYCDEEGKGTGGGLFFMSAEEGWTLHKLATESPTEGVPMGIIVRLADSMLTILETLHAKGKLLHCDSKSDNWIFKVLPSGQYFLKLIDFGRSQDLPSLTEHFRGSAVANDEDMMCKAMRQGKVWGVEQDFYGVCGVVFVLIIKYSHMEKKYTPIKDGKMEVYFPPSKFLKRDVKSMWKDFFELLLNFDSSDYTNTVRKAREVLKPYLEKNKEEIDRDFEDLCRRVSN